MGCASAPVAPSVADTEAKTFVPEAGKANLYILRGHGPGTEHLFAVVLDDRTAGWLAPDTYQMLSVAPGKHVVAVVTELTGDTAEEVEVNAVAGQNRFYLASLRATFGEDRAHLKPLSDAEGRKKLVGMKRAM
jgi:hypothetical protein